MDKQSLPLRILIAGLPLVLIALVFGTAGYVLTDPEPEPIPSLIAPAAPPLAVRGEIAMVSGSDLELITESGATLQASISSNATVERLEPISRTALKVGDWLNGGAILHPETLLALVGLIMIPDPVEP